MARLIDIILVLFGLPPIRYVDDGWLADWRAKCGHFALHGAVAFLATWLGGGWFGAACGLFWTLTFGTQYELYDSARGVGFSRKDWLVNLLGCLAGILLGFIT